MQNNILVTIITVAYNSEATIADTIESVLGQTYPHLEYIIIDGKSKDHTVAVCESYREKFEKKGIVYRIVSEPDKGMYDAINKGTRLARGMIIGSINSDDWYEANAVETVVRTYEETKFDMFYADLRIIKPTGNVIKHSKKRRLVCSRDWNHPTTFLTKEMYNKYQYKLESMYDDFDLMIRIRKNGHRVVIRNEVLANFRFGGMSTTKNVKETMDRIKVRYRIYRNNGYSRFYMLECLFSEGVKFLLA